MTSFCHPAKSDPRRIRITTFNRFHFRIIMSWLSNMISFRGSTPSKLKTCFVKVKYWTIKVRAKMMSHHLRILMNRRIRRWVWFMKTRKKKLNRKRKNCRIQTFKMKKFSSRRRMIRRVLIPAPRLHQRSKIHKYLEQMRSHIISMPTITTIE